MIPGSSGRKMRSCFCKVVPFRSITIFQSSRSGRGGGTRQRRMAVPIRSTARASKDHQAEICTRLARQSYITCTLFGSQKNVAGCTPETTVVVGIPAAAPSDISSTYVEPLSTSYRLFNHRPTFIFTNWSSLCLETERL